MKYYFELRKDKIDKEGLIPIRLIVSAPRVRIRKNLSVKTKLEHWDAEINQIRNIKSDINPLYNDYKEYNAVLANTVDKVEHIFDFFKFNSIPFTEMLFEEKFKLDSVSVAIRFFDAFNEYIKVSSVSRAKSTIIKYNSVKNFFMEFAKSTKYVLRFDTIDYRFEDAFMEYCFVERNTLNNYYGKLISTLKAFMQWAFNRGYHNSLEFKKIKRVDNEIEVVFLSMEELMKLYHYNFTSKSMQRARDMFCFLCFTGQRHSDIYSLRDCNVVGDYLNYTVVKTKTVHHQVYLMSYAKEILDKYKDSIYSPIPRITSQKLNERLKECCEEVGITDKIRLTRYVGSKRIDTVVRKCDVITSHVGRKTFITNSIILEISERVIKSTTNHKDERSFRRYVHVGESFKQKELNKWETL
ncbi:phage integrase SAM-like domain-containing protein [Myroides odoratimimus]|uniref:phage integrase SAM-like domain-containing protein n=1 Tax=Myroides odoratimimus TaxID=76832 RepID=UPI0025778246|nr:phage integrase SAM-like domain-containing protein [Myroides odoratimimus]MDM1504986.1 phage integrase SAM-like domain-containing protein [Myroides odoratimimus]